MEAGYQQADTGDSEVAMMKESWEICKIQNPAEIWGSSIRDRLPHRSQNPESTIVWKHCF